jgi:hypothetical protein
MRSQVGAQRAVEEAEKCCTRLLSDDWASQGPSAIKRAAEDTLPQALVREWQQAVQTHIDANPFRTEELDAIEAGHHD